LNMLGIVRESYKLLNMRFFCVYSKRSSLTKFRTYVPCLLKCCWSASTCQLQVPSFGFHIVFSIPITTKSIYWCMHMQYGNSTRPYEDKYANGGVLVKGTSKGRWVLDVMIILCTFYGAFDI
jgi:hypothetical protein